MLNTNKIKRRDYEIITTMIHNDSTVLDLGCGDGSLLQHLTKERNVSGYGVEKDHRNVLASLSNGVNVIQSDLEQGLSGFADSAFDYVILSLTLQAVHETETIMNEMLRVGSEVIVTFPTLDCGDIAYKFFWDKHRYQKSCHINGMTRQMFTY